MNPPKSRHNSREEGDAWCQKLLLLGAKWWDSNDRYHLLHDEDQDVNHLGESGEPLPTMKERHWVSVAWPSTGGLVVSEFDTTMWGVERDCDEFVPEDVARLQLCTSMDEKAKMLKERFQGKVWGRVEEYRGNAFIGCWGVKDTGEVGGFWKTWAET